MKKISQRGIQTSFWLQFGLKGITLFLFFRVLILGLNCNAQDINRIEYFFDTDPGVGNGVSLTFNPAPNLTNLNFTIPVASLSDGFHQLFFRSRDENLKWSISSVRPFFKGTIPGAFPDITKVEYFFDTDPGTGNGTNIVITPATNLNNLVVNIPVGGVPNGFHTLYLRSRDANGKWSLVSGKTFYAATSPASLPNVTKVEYFIDTDPGFGLAISVPVSPATNISNLFFPVDLLCLSVGVHHLYVRALDSFGKWSLVTSGTMTKTGTLINVTGPTNICGGQSVQLEVSSAPGRTYQWHRNNTPVSGATGSAYQATESGNFYARITAQGGCTDTSNSVTVNVTPSSPVSVSIAASVNPVYPGSSVTFTATPVNGGTAPVFQWKVNGVNVGVNSPTYTYTPDNNDVITCMLTSNMVCPSGNPATSNAITATGIPAITVTPASLNYGVVYIGQSAIRTVTISNTGTAYLHVTAATNNPQFVAGVPAVTVPPSQSYALMVAYQPVTTGNTSAALMLSSNAPGQATVTIPLTGQGLPAPVISVVPASLTDTLEPGQVSMQQLKIRNHGGSPLTFTLSETVSWLNEWPVSGTLLPGDSVMVGVSFSSGQSTMTFNTNIKIISNDPVTSLIYIPVSLTVVAPLWVETTATPASVCAGMPSQLSAIPHGGYAGRSYSWSSTPAGFSSTLQNPLAYPTVTTNYTVNISDGHSTANSQVTVTVFPNQAPTAVSNMLPANNATGVPVPVLLSWSPSFNSETYDLYIWRSNTTHPSTPYAPNITQVNYLFNATAYWYFNYGDTLNWQVVAKNPCFQTPGPVLNFTLTKLPNLHVTSVTNSQPLAGQPVTITWTVRNDGEAATPQGTYWLDRVWISPDLDVRTGEPEDVLLGQFQNVSYLLPGESYTHSEQIIMPANLVGTWFLFVIADDLDALWIGWPPSGPPLPYNPPPFLTASSHGGSTVMESVEHDNFFYKEMVFPVPPVPDLQVTSILKPANLFSGQPANITWTVKNKGNGNTGTGTWNDRLFFSQDTLFNQVTAITLGTFSHSGILNPDSCYTQMKSVTVPPNIFGPGFFFVKTDAGNNVFEYLYENNNITRSDSVNVFLTPPPDLVVTSLAIPDTVSNHDLFNIAWTVKNQGATAPVVSAWKDAVYLSASPDYDLTNSIYIGTFRRDGTLAPDSSYTVTETLNISNTISGPCYMYIRTDVSDTVYEYSGENNNILRSDTSMIVVTPDLCVAAMTVPAVNNTSLPMEIQWSVKNNGPGKIYHQSWKDKIMASESPVYNPDSVVTVATVNHGNVTLLQHGMISQRKTVSLPDSLSGPCYIYIHTDCQNTVFENGQEANNLVRSSGSVTMLKPDLAISNILAPAMDTTGQPFAITWKISNVGQGTVYDRSWTDRIMLSYSPVYNPESVIGLDSLRYEAFLPAGISLTKQMVVSLPDSLPGPFYFFIRADCKDEIYENLSEANNIARSPSAVQKLRPDLIVKNLVVPDSAVSGDSIIIRWITKNNGLVTINNKTWSDRVTLSPQAAYNPASDLLLGNLTVSQTLHTGDSVQNQLKAALPEGKQGLWFIHIYTDFSNNIPEGINEHNNTAAAALQLAFGPWADLQVTNTGVPDSSSAGSNIPLNYIVKNSGTKALHQKQWTDKICLSNLPVWSPASATCLRIFNKSEELIPNAAYTCNTTVNLPATLQTGNYFIYVFTDADSAIFENTGENNNVLRSSPLYLHSMPPTDLNVTNVISPVSANSHEQVTVRWTVTNPGNGQTLFSWDDAVYLSSDTIFSKESDIFLGQRLHYGALPMGSNYSGILAVNLPDGVSGEYYLLAVADYQQTNYDTNLQNNSRSRVNAANVMQPIHITLLPPPDLVVTALSSPTQAFTGMPFNIQWTVKNNGTGETVPGIWADRLYLSTDFTIGDGDILLGSRSHAGALGVNQGYTDSLQVTLPANLSGNYILLAKTDYGNAVYEMNENNNVSYSFVVVTTPPPADLRVSPVIPPSAVMAGENATVQWTLKNSGQNIANGTVKDMVYFSSDPFWDINDVLFGSYESFVTLAPGSSLSRSITARVNNLPVGYYYAIVKTDVLNAIFETNENNNITSSSSNFFADVRVLPLGVLSRDTLHDSENLYYRIPVADSLSKETMLTTLKGDSINGMNEMYLKNRYMPTRISYDYSSGNPYGGNQEILVPAVTRGNNYLLLYGNTLAGDRQPVSVLASVMNFGILSADPSEGGNTGQVTLNIRGSKFDPGVSVKLQRSTRTILAKNTQFVDYSKIFATFDLSGELPGLYNLVVEKRNGSSVSLANGFEIVEGTAADLRIMVAAPPAARANRVTSFVIEFANLGNTNLVDPKLTVNSKTSSPIALSVEQLPALMHQLVIHLQEENGPAGILRPGVTGSVTVYTKTTAGLGFTIMK